MLAPKHDNRKEHGKKGIPKGGGSSEICISKGGAARVYAMRWGVLPNVGSITNPRS
jgi:hypothetical protein